MKINFIDIKDKKIWNKITRNNSELPGHTYDYFKFCSLNLNKKLFLLDLSINKNNIFCPVNVDEFRSFHILKSIPGYSGFNCDLNLKDIINLNKLLLDNKILTFFFNSNPYSESKLFKNSEFVSFKNHSYILDLNNSLIETKNNIHRNLKKNIVKVDDLKISINEVEKLDFKILRYLYLKTCNRLNIYPGNFYKTSALKFLLDEYKNKLIVTASYKARIVSVSIFLYEKNYSDYLLNFSEDDYNFCTSSLILKSFEILKNNSIKFMNLGGGITNKDGLERFKKNFNSIQKNIYSFKIISDQKIYNEFSINHKNNFFPPFVK